MKRQTLILVVMGMALGGALGVGGYTFIYAKGYSYLTNDPKACMNCHVMQEQYDGWIKSSHRSVATCNDCHTPHDLIGKYYTKSHNGFWHSYYFTSGTFPDPIQITERNRKITEAACRNCHADIVATIEAPTGATSKHFQADQTDCLRCHRSVGHLH
jgi:cytochrome c nitrite reductase small subunit